MHSYTLHMQINVYISQQSHIETANYGLMDKIVDKIGAKEISDVYFMSSSIFLIL